jgi:signal transduction histidine kinase/ligand-binding sensor domain-containing protein
VIARLVFLSLLATSSACAQLHSLDVSQYLHTSWLAQDGYFRGLGSGGVMAQTADGYIWILSVTGLLRFDGVRFAKWKPPNGESLPGKPPSALLASKDGSLWIAGHGVAELRPDGTWHRYHELDNSSLVTLAEGKDGVIWAGVGGRSRAGSCSLYRIDHRKAECYERPEFANLNFSSLYVDREGRLWADTEIGIWRILPGPPTLVQKMTTPVVAFSEDSQGSLLYTRGGSIWKLSAEGKSVPYLTEIDGTRINGRTMLSDREGGLWIGTNGQGIVHLHEGRVDRFSSFDGLSSDYVQAIYQDREGNVWVTTPDGIDKFTKPAVPRLTRKQGLSSDSVLSVLIDRRGRTWVGTENGLNELVGGQVLQPSLRLRHHPALALVETHTGRLIVATFDRNRTSVQTRWHIVPDEDGRVWLEGSAELFTVTEDAKGTLWAASRELGLLHFRTNGELIRRFRDQDFGDYPLSVAYDSQRMGIWFTTHQGDLFFLKGDRILRKYGVADGLGYGPVRVSEVDKDGGVWLTTKVGLAYLKDGKISLLGRRNGLPCDAVHWMRRGQDDNIWLYTECGLVSFSEADLQSWIAHPLHTVTITHYLDNTEGVECTTGSGWYTPLTAMTEDGRILFAMETGLGVLDPHHLNYNALPPPVHIEEITADGREIEHSSGASLPPNTDVIRIVYTALSFDAPRKVRFRYRLLGYDKEWSSPVSLREATYTNLPPGNYRFEVVACNNDGVWNNKGATLRFFVAPSWYQTLWFRFLAVLAAISLLTAFYVRRIGRIEREVNLRFEERMAERMRIARELHDTLLQSLQGLVLSFSSFSARVTATPEVREEMERSLERGDQLAISGRERIRDLRAAPTKVEDLTTALSAVVGETIGDFGSNFSVRVTGTPIPLQEVVQDEAIWIIREALANVRQHSGADAVQLLISFQVGEFRISVEDNGRGFESGAPHTSPNGHFGLTGMHERAQTIGGRLSVSSFPAKGTSVELSVPGRIAYNGRRGWFGGMFSAISWRVLINRKIR